MKKYTFTEQKDTRSGFGAGLAELGRTNPNVVALCADLIGSLKMEKFIEENPERFFQIGIAEANMIGIAAGIALIAVISFGWPALLVVGIALIIYAAAGWANG